MNALRKHAHLPPITSRLLDVIEKITTKHRRNKQLEELTGIDSERWSAVSLGRQRPTAEMLEGITKAFPSLCLWLMTGQDDKANKQYDIHTFLALKKYNVNDLLKKEPLDLNDDELRVIKVINAELIVARTKSNNPTVEQNLMRALL